MILEINLVKVPSMGSMRGSLLERQRYSSVDTDAEMLSSTVRFIKDNLSVLMPAITDSNFIEKLRNLRNLTIQELFELRYVLSSRFGIDLWIQFVADLEVNSQEVPDDSIEFNIVDHTNLIGVTPFATKKVQLEKNVSLTDIYSSINTMYGLFSEPLFNGMRNPIEGVVASAKKDEELVGRIPVNRTAYLNSVIELLGKQLMVISN
jgi:hypothetical protein